MASRRRLPTLLVLALLLAGCLAAPAQEAGAPLVDPSGAPSPAPPTATLVPPTSATRPPTPPSTAPPATTPPAAMTPPAATPTPTAAPEEPAASPPPEGALRVRVDAQEGPWGGAPVDIDRRFWGMNVADWRPEDYRDGGDPDFVTYLRALEPGILRWPAGHTSQEWRWSREVGHRNLTPEHVEDFLALAREVGAEPLILVNMKRGTPEQAADFVRYVNVEQGHDVTWWALGNEPDLEDEFNEGPEAYAEDALRFARAMREVDPSIRLVGAELMTGAHVMGIKGRDDWMRAIAETAGHELDALSWHYYPLDSAQRSRNSSAYPTIEHLFQESADDWPPAGLAFVDELWPHLAATRDEHAPGAELWVTEFAEDSGRGGMEGIVDRHAGALWAADALGRFARHGADAVCRFVFRGSSMHNFALVSKEGELRPGYATYWLLSREYGDRIVAAESGDVAHVAAHASLRPDGSLAILLVNKREEAQDVALDIDGFPVGEVQRYVLQGESYDATDVTINGHALGLDNVLTGIPGEPVQLAAGGVVRADALTVTLLVVERA